MPSSAAAILGQHAKLKNKELAVLLVKQRGKRKAYCEFSTLKKEIEAPVMLPFVRSLYCSTVFLAVEILALLGGFIGENVPVMVCAQLAPEARGFLSGDRFADRNLIFH